MATLNEDVTSEPEQSDIFNAYLEVLSKIVHSRAAWLFTALFLASDIYLILAGRPRYLLPGLFSLAFLLLTFLIVIPLTSHRPLPAWEEPLTYPRARLWRQLALVFAMVLAIIVMGYQGLHGGVPRLEGLLYIPLAIIIPLVGMRLLGANWRELGVGRGYHTWGVTIALIIVPFILMTYGIIVGKHSPVDFLIAPLGSMLTAGLPEEIIFRGILMTRLTRLFTMQWGIVLSALIFGLMHFAVNPGYVHATISESVALSITYQATFGLALGLVLQRTRNLVAGIMYHAFIDGAALVLLPLVVGFLAQH